ncbi:hypothetical protein Ciccas_011861, partial [Cichlidogyrus casuarinus]
QDKRKVDLEKEAEEVVVSVPFSGVIADTLTQQAEELLSSPKLGSLLLSSLRLNQTDKYECTYANNAFTPSCASTRESGEAQYDMDSAAVAQNMLNELRASPQTLIVANLIKNFETATGRNPLELIREAAALTQEEEVKKAMMENSWRQPEKGILKNKNDPMNNVNFSSHQSDISSSKTTLQGDDHSSSTTPERSQRHRKHKHRHRKSKHKRREETDSSSSDSSSSISSDESLQSSSSDSETEDVPRVHQPVAPNPIMLPLPMPLIQSQTPVVGLPPNGVIMTPSHRMQKMTPIVRTSAASSGSNSRYEELECTSPRMVNGLPFFQPIRPPGVSTTVGRPNSDSEWEEVECTGPNCEECKHKQRHITVQETKSVQKVKCNSLTNGSADTVKTNLTSSSSVVSSQFVKPSTHRPLPPHPNMIQGNSLELHQKSGFLVHSQHYNSSSSCSNSSLLGKRSAQHPQPHMMVPQTQPVSPPNSQSPTYSQPPRDEEEPESSNLYAVHGSITTEPHDDDEGVLSLDECYSSSRMMAMPQQQKPRNYTQLSDSQIKAPDTTCYASEYQNTDNMGLRPSNEIGSPRAYSMPYEFLSPEPR